MVLYSSCQNDQNKTKKEDTSAENIEQVTKPKALIVEIDLESSIPEDFKLMSINTFLNNGQFMDIYITQKINANETAKTIRFEMPENITPDNFVGISFGTKSIKEVKINNINLSFGDLNYNIQSEAVLDYFRTNKYMDYDETLNVFKTKQVEGKHNPILMLRQLYIDKIQEVK
ncbi:hypothetical protein [Psychroserpens sp.]|uniref:hypothetical protein n=1 Tax=Psychroserpens sp. TaxID=2020870 RepID=UPI002B272B85|nr:hypothetical protein [Psychroserpens sp.]